MHLRLRELEIFGLKSFGEKAFLVFPSNLNVILGPNGSGKSNVVDSIRWVLGDQSSRNLRISESEDLLYIGQKGNNLAWVRISLEMEGASHKEDGATFEIQRKIHRNGENEYFLNNEPVRLKDIQKFLAENQIGTRGFTIVNQGSADLFIKASPEERYIMLSEILGIRALEIKKFETKRNLEQIRERLKIAKMKLHSLEPQAEIFSLEQQKRERKVKIEAKLDELFIAIRGKRKFLLKERIETLKAEIVQTQKQLEVSEKELEESSKDIQQTSTQEKLSELRKQESELWKERSNILEKNLASVTTIKSKKKITAIDFVKEKLNLALVLEGVDEIKKIIKEILKHIKPAEKNEQGNSVTKTNLEIQNEIKKIDAKLEEIKVKIIDEEKREKEEREKINQKLLKFKEVQNKIFELKHFEEKLIEESKSIEITLNELKSSEEQSATQEELGTLIREEAQLKTELLRLGDINDEIIYKGERILKNLKVLQKETGDLDGSYTKLYNLLTEYQDKIKTAFDDGIKKINQSLIEYFYKLYGGTAKLTLRDEKKVSKKTNFFGIEISVSGVHVSVEHPQKKIKVLEALSGGEKALFSIALIFALIKISEPPFLVLDEIDAALDEQNSYKFSEFLKELSKKTQFIIVSHNRSTIESADILFGVSMQKGISKVFSLKLKEALKTIEN